MRKCDKCEKPATTTQKLKRPKDDDGKREIDLCWACGTEYLRTIDDWLESEKEPVG